MRYRVCMCYKADRELRTLCGYSAKFQSSFPEVHRKFVPFTASHVISQLPDAAAYLPYNIAKKTVAYT